MSIISIVLAPKQAVENHREASLLIGCRAQPRLGSSRALGGQSVARGEPKEAEASSSTACKFAC